MRHHLILRLLLIGVLCVVVHADNPIYVATTPRTGIAPLLITILARGPADLRDPLCVVADGPEYIESCIPTATGKPSQMWRIFKLSTVGDYDVYAFSGRDFSSHLTVEVR